MYLDNKPPQILPGSEYIYVVDIEGIALIVFFPVGPAHLWLPPSRGLTSDFFGKPPTGSPPCPKSVIGACIPLASQIGHGRPEEPGKGVTQDKGTFLFAEGCPGARQPVATPSRGPRHAKHSPASQCAG